MIIKNGIVLDKGFRFREVDIEIEGNRIVKIGKIDNVSGEVIDAKGRYVIPGLVDVHTHGCGGCDFCDGKKESLETISKTQAREGITSLLGTSMTLSEDRLEEIFKVYREYVEEQERLEDIQGAKIIGINMEGPFFNIGKKGAQAGKHIVRPDIGMYRRLNKASGGRIKMVCIAPEVDGAIEFIREVSKESVLSIAHTMATYGEAMDAIQNGASHITHLYNAMPGFTHRESGVIGACYDSEVMAELISDGIHVSAPVIRSTFKTLGDDRVILISDSMCACGMPNGEYELGGQKVYVKDKKATLEDGTIAGSSTNLMDCMRKAIEFGVKVESAIKAATINGAKSIGVDKEIGSIDIGKRADILILDKGFGIDKVLIEGRILRR